MASDKELKDNRGGVGDFLSGLWDAVSMGAKNTGYALQDDWSDIKEGKMPHNLSRDVPGLLGMMGQPAVNPTVSAMQKMAFDPQRGWYVAETVPGGDWLSIFGRQGGFGDFISRMLRMFEEVP